MSDRGRTLLHNHVLTLLPLLSSLDYILSAKGKMFSLCTNIFRFLRRQETKLLTSQVDGFLSHWCHAILQDELLHSFKHHLKKSEEADRLQESLEFRSTPKNDRKGRGIAKTTPRELSEDYVTRANPNRDPSLNKIGRVHKLTQPLMGKWSRDRKCNITSTNAK